MGAEKTVEGRSDAPARIWATVNGASTRLPDGGRQFIGGWSEDSQRPRATEYIRADIARDLVEALRKAIQTADEAREEWDKAPSGMRAGKILIALAGDCPGYRADIDAIHAALRNAEEATSASVASTEKPKGESRS